MVKAPLPSPGEKLAGSSPLHILKLSISIFHFTIGLSSELLTVGKHPVGNLVDDRALWKNGLLCLLAKLKLLNITKVNAVMQTQMDS